MQPDLHHAKGKCRGQIESNRDHGGADNVCAKRVEVAQQYVTEDSPHHALNGDGMTPPQRPGRERQQGREEHQQHGPADALGHGRDNLAGAKPAQGEKADDQRHENYANPRRLQQQVAHKGPGHPNPVADSVSVRRGRCVQRWIERRIAGQREEKKGSANEQKEANQLIEPVVLRGRKNPDEILHEGVRPFAGRQKFPTIGQSTPEQFLLCQTSAQNCGKMLNTSGLSVAQ